MTIREFYTLVGRHALLLYVLHQPLLYALTMLLRLIFIR